MPTESDNQTAGQLEPPSTETKLGSTTALHLPDQFRGVSVTTAAVSTRKRGKSMTRRSGQNPKLEIRNGFYTFRYRKDVAGVEERKQVREVLGPVKQMTKSEAERRIKEFMVTSELNTAAAKIPSVLTFAQAVKYYRDKFAPRMLRASAYSIADSHLKAHLEPDWNDVPVEHITLDSVNEWIWKKRKAGLSWTTIKNILRTMQRVLSVSSKDKKPPFSQQGLAIPEKRQIADEDSKPTGCFFFMGRRKTNSRCSSEARRFGRVPKEQLRDGFPSGVRNRSEVWRVVRLASERR